MGSDVKFAQFALFLVVYAVSFKSVLSDVIAKSSLQICENTGDSEDPFNVVDQKACEKKLIVTLSVRSGQVSSTSLYYLSLKNQVEIVWNV